MLAKDKDTLVEQNERTKRSRHFLMQQKVELENQIVALQNQIVAMKREMEELSAENEKKSSEILKQKEELVELKRKPREVKLMNYDDVKSNKGKRERLQKACDYLQNLAG